MKKLKRLATVVVFSALTCIALIANSQETEKEVKSKDADKESITTKFCKIVPFLCGQPTLAGNGDGEEPPRPTKP